MFDRVLNAFGKSIKKCVKPDKLTNSYNFNEKTKNLKYKQRQW